MWSKACYAVRWLFHISDITTLNSVHFSYFHSIIKCAIIFRDNSSNSGKILALQKKYQNYRWCVAQKFMWKSILQIRHNMTQLLSNQNYNVLCYVILYNIVFYCIVLYCVVVFVVSCCILLFHTIILTSFIFRAVLQIWWICETRYVNKNK
jgi:hypothetical protein